LGNELVLIVVEILTDHVAKDMLNHGFVTRPKFRECR
jgi:hypothetical protein